LKQKKKVVKIFNFWILKMKKKIEIASIPRTAATGTNFASPPLDEIFVENFCRKFRINRNLQKFFFSQHEKVMVDDTLTCTNKKLECLSFVSLSPRSNMCTVRLGSYPLIVLPKRHHSGKPATNPIKLFSAVIYGFL